MPAGTENLLNSLSGGLENIAARRDKNIFHQRDIFSRNLYRGLGPRIRDTHFVTDILNTGINRWFVCRLPGGGGLNWSFFRRRCFSVNRDGLRNVRLFRNDEETMTPAAFGFLIGVDSGQPVFLAAFMAPENDFIL